MKTGNSYFDFLCGLVGRDRSAKYTQMLKLFHHIDFRPLVPNDDNREVDGEQLRDKFIDEVGPTGTPSLPNGPCTMLEMLIGLAYRLEFELGGGRYEHPAYYWFWVLVDNLDLNWCDNFEFYQNDSKNILQEKMGNLVERRYERNGNGGLFPLRNPKRDQRKVEIWYQMSDWIIENYPI